MVKLENFKDIPIGTKLELNVTDPIEGKLNIGFVSQIEGYLGENLFRIAAPIFEAKIYPIRVNSRIEAYVFYNSNQIYKIDGYVEDRLIINDIALLDLRVSPGMQRIQRRKFFRFSCSIPIVFYKQKVKEENEEALEEISGLTIDLSGGGLSAVTGEQLVENDIFMGKLKLDDGSFIDFNGKVVRSIKYIVKDEIRYVSSLSFTDIDYKYREKIIGYIFNQQRLLLKKS